MLRSIINILMVKFINNKLIKYALIILSITLVLYLIIAVYLYFAYKNEFNTHTSLGGVDISGLKIEEASTKVNAELSKSQIKISSNNNSEISGNATDFGLYLNDSYLKDELTKQSIERALLIFWSDKNIEYKININKEKLSSTLSNLSLPDGMIKPINARYDFDNNKNIIVVDEVKGFGLEENLVIAKLEDKFSNSLGYFTSDIPLSEVTPRINSQILQEKINDVKNIQKLTLNLVDQIKTYTIPTDDIIKYLSLDYSNKIYIPEEYSKYIIESFVTNNINTNPINGATYVFSNGTTKSLIDGQNGKKVSNTIHLSSELSKSVKEMQDLQADLAYEESKYTNSDILVPLDKKIYRYKVSTWGNINSNLNEFRINAAETLNSALGWSSARIAFVEDPNNYDFNLVLSNPQELVNNFPGTCDSFYSCQVANYIIINDDRWRKATPVWTKSIRDYQHLVINHETGHWLGLGHYSCNSAGSPAPVMQQQSINLGFCTFNEWPLDYEIIKI